MLLERTYPTLDRQRLVSDQLPILQDIAVSNAATSASFARLAIQTSVLVNSGALFVLPSYLSANNIVLDRGLSVSLALAACSFGAGIVLAMLCAFFAYSNYQHHSHAANQKIFVLAFRNTEEGEDDHNQYLKQAHESLEKINRKIQRSMVAGNAFLWSSFFVFIVGAIMTGTIILSPR